MASAADRDVGAATAAPGSQGGASDQVVQLPPAGAAADAPTTGQVHDEEKALPAAAAAGASPPEKISEVPKTDSSVAHPESSQSPSSEKFDDADEPEPVVSVKVWIVAVVRSWHHFPLVSLSDVLPLVLDVLLTRMLPSDPVLRIRSLVLAHSRGCCHWRPGRGRPG